MAPHRAAEIVAAAVASAGSDDTLPERICLACQASLPVSGVALALMSERGHEGQVAATPGLGDVLERLQFDLGEGPCVDASRSGRPVLQPELGHTGPRRWPAFAPAALEAGIEAIFSFPLQVGRIRLGVLDLCRDTPGPLTSDQLGTGLSYADAATTVLLNSQAGRPLDGDLHPELIDPGLHLAEVHQATGMVAVQAAVGLVDALLLLRSRAFADDRPLFDVACDVVTRRLRFQPGTEHDE